MDLTFLRGRGEWKTAGERETPHPLFGRHTLHVSLLPFNIQTFETFGSISCCYIETLPIRSHTQLTDLCDSCGWKLESTTSAQFVCVDLKMSSRYWTFQRFGVFDLFRFTDIKAAKKSRNSYIYCCNVTFSTDHHLLTCRLSGLFLNWG